MSVETIMTYAPPGELPTCPSCEEPGVTHLDFVRDKRPLAPGHFAWFISGCHHCGLIFTNPPPSSQEISARYQEGGSWDKKLKERAARPPEEIEAKQEYAAGLRSVFVDAAEVLRRPNETPRVLDFGCGPGLILNSLQDLGWDTIGLDPCPPQPITRHKMITTMPDEPGYDLVIMRHVLEHFLDPLAPLRQARKCVTDHGHIIVAVPTLDRLSEHGKKRYCINRRHHVTAWTRRSLTQMLGVAGFEVVNDLPSTVTQRMAVVARASVSKVPFPDPLARCGARTTGLRQIARMVQTRPCARWGSQSIDGPKAAEGMASCGSRRPGGHHQKNA